MEYKNIIFEVKDGVATITFNRPEVLNALSDKLLKELSHALDKIAENEDIRVLILTGAGGKSFVAGADIKEIAAFDALDAKSFAQTGQSTINKFEKLPVPVIAAVNGLVDVRLVDVARGHRLNALDRWAHAPPRLSFIVAGNDIHQRTASHAGSDEPHPDPLVG